LGLGTEPAREDHVHHELALRCHGCAGPVTGDHGYLWVPLGQVQTAEQAYLLWEQRHDKRREQLLLTNLADLLSLPEPVRWRAHHEACDPDAENWNYRIPALQLSTRAGLLDWSVHILGKHWSRVTDWTELMRETRTGSDRFTLIAPCVSL
jgi:hypothetical protein